MPSDDSPDATSLFASHARDFAENRYVYPVLSRRAGGISSGVNLNRDKHCNFRCVYCQVDRSAPGETGRVDLERLAAELDRSVALVLSGRLFAEGRFRDAPAGLRRLNDIALSGDGEPTASPDFGRAVEVCADVRRRHRLETLKLVLITNASLLHRPPVRRAIETLQANGGEIWAKLDAGTEDYYRLVDRSTVPWRRILDNLGKTAKTWPIVIQSLFMRIHGEPPSEAELDAYCDRLREIASGGGRIQLVQIHTIARKPAESWVAPLENERIDALADRVRSRTGLPTAAYYGGKG